jgi:hypothetical protein
MPVWQKLLQISDERAKGVAGCGEMLIMYSCLSSRWRLGVKSVPALNCRPRHQGEAFQGESLTLRAAVLFSFGKTS